MPTFATLSARDHSRARRRLAALIRAASLGGISLAALAPAAAAQQAAQRTAQATAPTGRGSQPRQAPVREATYAERAALASDMARTMGGGYSLQAGVITFDVGQYSSPTLADVDNDGDLDLAIGAGGTSGTSGQIFYFTNNGSGGFTQQVGAANPFNGIDVGADARPSLGDVDGDGDADLVVGNETGNLRYYRNDAGTFTLQSGGADPFGGADFGAYTGPTLGDVDGDGDLDLLAGLSTGAILYFEGNGSGGFTQVTGAGNPANGINIGSYAALDLVDVDGDGDLDFVGGQPNGTFVVYANSLAPGFTTPAFAAAASPFAGLDAGDSSDPTLGDIDGDGDLDLISGNAAGTTLVWDYSASSQPTVTLNGDTGWRMLGSPDPTATVLELLDDPLWLQGAPGGDVTFGDPNVFVWDETIQDHVPADLTSVIGDQALFVFVFPDNDYSTPGTVDGFPKTLDVDGPVTAANEYTIGPLSYTNDADPGTVNDGLNAVSTPAASWFDWDAVDLTNVGTTVYVYDDAVSAFRTYTQGSGPGGTPLNGGVIAPFQGIYVVAQAPGASFTIHPETSDDGPFYGRVALPAAIAFSVRPGAGAALPEAIRGGALVTFRAADASDAFGPEDAVALVPPAAEWLSLQAEAQGAENETVSLTVAQQAWPNGISEVPISLDVVGAEGDQPLVLSWPSLRDVPEGWKLTLVDHLAGTEVDLRTASEYAFTAAGRTISTALGRAEGLAQPIPVPLGSPTVPARLAGARGEPARFTLRVESLTTGVSEAPAGTDVSLAQPNPTSGRSVVRVAVASPEHVRVAVYDALGRVVARAYDGEVTSAVDVAIDASRLAAGLYVVRVEGERFVESRTLTVTR